MTQPDKKVDREPPAEPLEGRDERALELIRAREALLTEAERIAHMGSYVWEPGKQTLWSDEFHRILGYEPGTVEVGAEAFFSTVHAEDLSRVRDAWLSAAQGEMPDIEYRILRNGTGEVRFVRGSGRVDRDAGGQVVRVVGAILDITESKRSALALEEAAVVTRVAERLALVGTFVLRVDTLEVRWSGGLQHLMRVAEGEAVPDAWDSLVHPDDRERQIEWWGRVLRKEAPEPLQARVVRRDGEIRHMYAQAAVLPFQSDGVERVVGTIIDVTERVKLEEGLRDAAKMEAIGTLAAGLAHDFNNYLMAAESSLHLLATCDDPSQREKPQDNARLALDRCSALTRQLLTFARRQPFSPETVDVRDVIVGFRGLLVQSLGRRAALVLELAERPLAARVDPRHLERILANLALNAADAIGEGDRGEGLVRIVAERVKLDRPQGVPPNRFGPGRFVRVAVEDNGGGIESKALPRIFEPYFTTKSPGRGTGLGLSSVYGMARQNNGWVTVHSGDAGAVFSLWFEEAPSAAAETGDEAQATPDRATALKARLLVVDDIPQVRKVAVRMLRSAGFETLEAESGEQALALLGDTAIHLVVTDFDMPGMNGITLARRARREHPALAVVLMTGYADRALAALDDLALPVLEKPFSARQLVEVVLNQLS